MSGTGKMLFGTNKLGRQRRVVTCDSSTFLSCEWMPNFKGSQRGCVLKQGNDALSKLGIKKRSQIDAINNVDHSNHPFKKISKILNEKSKSDTEFNVTFMTQELTVKTVEIFFRGAFCPSVEFCAEGDGTNFIIENIPYEADGKILIDKAELKRGYRVTKVKSTKVTGKKYDEIRKMILAASNDMRVDYSVVFEEGDMSWYNFQEPPPTKINKKHQRTGSGRFVHTKKKSQRGLSKKIKSRHVRAGSKGKGKSSMSFDFASVDWSKEISLNNISHSATKSSGNISDSVPSAGDHSPSFSSLASVAEDKQIHTFNTFNLEDDDYDDDNNNNNDNDKNTNVTKPTLQVIHSGEYKPNQIDTNMSDATATVNDDNTNNISSLLAPSPQKKKKKSVNFRNNKDALYTEKKIKISETKKENVIPPKPVTPPPVDVNVICDLCQKTFIIKDNELQYHTLNEKENKNSIFGIAEGDEENDNISSPPTPVPQENTVKNLKSLKKTKNDDIIKYNGLCKECVKMECTIELSKFDAITLGPHLSGHSVKICRVDTNIHKYTKWIIDDDNDNKSNDDEKKEDKKEDKKDDKKDDKKEDKKENVKKKKKIKKVTDKNRKIGENFIILAINGMNVEMESFEVIFSKYYQESIKNKKIRLKLRKHFTNSHRLIVASYENHKNEGLEMKRILEEQKKAMLKKRALLTRNTNETMIDSDPDDDAESDTDPDDIDNDIDDISSSRPSSVRYHSRGINSGSRGVPLKRSKSRKHLKKKIVKHNIRLSHTSNDYDESDYGAAADENKSVEQLIEEHDGMIFIKEGEKLERDGSWEMAAINYERGVAMLDDYQKILKLSTREKRTFRQQLAEYRRKMLLVQNRLMRKSTTPRYSKQENNNNDKDKDKGKTTADEGDEGDDNNNKKKEKVNNKDDPDKAFRDRLEGDIITEAPNISFQDVTGLLNVKLALYECVILPQKRPELFTGLRKPTAGLLLFGPPGNGKTMIAKCVATECDATFFSISASSITSKYVGEAERIMRTLFNMAREKQPSIIFIDEIDSLLTARGGNNEAESSRRIKTEFLVQFDGVKATADGKEARVLVIGATNLPEQLDEAVLRRFGKRILVPVPDEDARYGILRNLASKQTNTLCEQDFRKIVQKTNLYSASDLTQVCKDASMGPLRDLGTAVLDLDQQIEVPPIQLKHFESSLKNVRASVKQESLIAYKKWDSKFGSKLTFKLSALPQGMLAHPIQPLE